jgi:tRNA (guanine37-N1)-methyltransferase
MVMQYEPIHQAVLAAKTKNANAKVIYVSPQGKPFTHARAKQIASTQQPLIFIAGRYEGIDERLFETDIDEEWSIGDYILSGGELAIAVIIDAITRLLPNVLGDDQSAEQDSFSNGLLDYPHYTRPAIVNGLSVPEVLLNGNHEEIKAWRLQQQIEKTQTKPLCCLKRCICRGFKRCTADSLVKKPF